MVRTGLKRGKHNLYRYNPTDPVSSLMHSVASCNAVVFSTRGTFNRGP